jgi:hypothetical protein
VDADTEQIIAAESTSNDVDDRSQVGRCSRPNGGEIASDSTRLVVPTIPGPVLEILRVSSPHASCKTRKIYSFLLATPVALSTIRISSSGIFVVP